MEYVFFAYSLAFNSLCVTVIVKAAVCVSLIVIVVCDRERWITSAMLSLNSKTRWLANHYLLTGNFRLLLKRTEKASRRDRLLRNMTFRVIRLPTWSETSWSKHQANKSAMFKSVSSGMLIELSWEGQTLVKLSSFLIRPSNTGELTPTDGVEQVDRLIRESGPGSATWILFLPLTMHLHGIWQVLIGRYFWCVISTLPAAVCYTCPAWRASCQLRICKLQSNSEELLKAVSSKCNNNNNNNNNNKCKFI